MLFLINERPIIQSLVIARAKDTAAYFTKFATQEKPDYSLNPLVGAPEAKTIYDQPQLLISPRLPLSKPTFPM
jgi:hypothetical protein